MARVVRLVLVVGIAFTLLTWFTHDARAQMGQGAVENEQLKTGDKWTYKRASGGEYDVVISEVLPDGYITEVTSLPGTKFHRDRTWAVTRIEGKVTGDPRNFIGWRWLDFPMSPGKKFSYQTDSSFGPVDVNAVVGNWQKITVPAGTFDALPIDGCWRNKAGNWTPCGQVWWYSPEVGTFIKRVSPRQSFGQLADFDFELVRFTRAR